MIALVGRPFAARRQRALVEAALADTIELLVLLVRSGHTPHQAVDTMSQHADPVVRPAFRRVRERVRRGATLADSLVELPVSLGASMSPVADSLAISMRHGTPIADAMTQLSMDARRRRQRRAEAAARQLPVRLSFPLVFCTLPSFVLVAIVPAVLAALSSLGDTAW